METPTLLSSDTEWREWLRKNGYKPHRFRGPIDQDCEACGFSIYAPIHSDGFRMNDPTEQLP